MKKKGCNFKTKTVILKSQCNFLDIIMLMLLTKFEFDGWFNFFKNKELSKK